MSESLIAYLLYGVLKALEYLHRMGYVHRYTKRRYKIHLDNKENLKYKNICILISVHIFLFSCQRGEGQSYPAVRGGACLSLRAPLCLQYDA